MSKIKINSNQLNLNLHDYDELQPSKHSWCKFEAETASSFGDTT